MKKVVILFAVLALAAPVFAQAEPNVYITCSEGSLTTTISYNATDAGVVRAFSMDLTVDGGATIDAISEYDAEGAAPGTTVPIYYSIYMSSIDFGTDPNNVDAWGDPVASGVDALGGLGTAGITVEMGSLYDMDAAEPDTPPLTGDLFKITVDIPCNLTIEDTVQKGTRGGIVLEDGSGANLVSSGCYLEDLGPKCWLCDGQDLGNANGDVAINFLDLIALKKAIFTTSAGSPHGTGQGEYNCCCDFTRDGAVNFLDLIRLKQNIFTSGYAPCADISCP